MIDVKLKIIYVPLHFKLDGNMNRIVLPLFLAMFVCCFPLQAQEDAQIQRLVSFVQNINAFSYLYPQEKVYLHFDNTGYYPGETVYFQSYVVVAQTHALSDLSGVLHVELLDAAGNIIQSKKLKIENGRAPGDFFLKIDMPAGFYEIRAYTRSMLNFGDEAIFSRVFPVFSRPRPQGNYTFTMPDGVVPSGKTEKRKKPESLSRINLSFYPEGGYMVAGLTCRMAVKAFDQRGESIEATGTVFNSSGDPVAFFATLHHGMGFFDLTPDGGKYTAEVTSGVRKDRFTLPEALAKGYTMQVTQRTGHLSVRVGKSQGLPSESMGITLACRGKIYAFTTFETGETEQFLFDFSKEGLPSGVCQLTLFNTAGGVLAERMVFVDNDTGIRITPLNITASFAPLTPITMDFAVSDSAGRPVSTSFSLSVRDRETETPSGYSGNVMTDLLFSSDLKGYIDDPAWYFDERNPQRVQALDMLMLTQGWRRYPWEVMAGKKPFEPTHYIEKNLLIEGKALEPTRDRPAKNTMVTMWMYSIAEGASQRGECPADEDGSFNFALDDFYGTWDLSLQTKEKGKRKHSRILLDRNFAPEPKILGYRETQIPEKADISENNREKLLVEAPETDTDIALPDSVRRIEEIVISARRRWRQENEGLRYADLVYDVRNEVDKLRDVGNSEMGNFIEFLLRKPDFTNAENFPHKIRKFCIECQFETIYIPTVIYKGRPVIFVVNNSPALYISIIDDVRNPDSLANDYNCGDVTSFVFHIVNDLLTDEIETVTIEESSGTAIRYLPACYIDKDKYVVVHIYTNSDGRRRVDEKDIRTTRLQGFSKPVEFYSPDYSQIPLPEAKDIRRTLYWNPDVTTDEEGKATVRFFNNDDCQAIRISAETVTADGRTGVY